jgi:hypothetical protein
LTRFRTFFVVCALALPIPAVIAGCGGDSSSSSSSEDPQTVLDETFNNDTAVSSGDLTLSASVSADGSSGGKFDASLSGPFQGDPSNQTALPQLDWTATVSGQGAGQSIDFSGGIVVTGDNAYVNYKDQAYEVGTQAFTQLQDQISQQAGSTSTSSSPASFEEACSQAIEQAGGDASKCKIDLSSWLTNLTNDGTTDVGGASTIHISGDADVQKILTDIGNLAASVPSAASSGFDPSQLGLVSGAVTNASIDVYSGVDDHLLRKLDLNLTIDPSVIPGASSSGVTGINVSFSIEIDGVNESQTITAPSNPKPISQLLSDAGIDPSALGSLGGASTGGSGSANANSYLQCIQQAGNNPDAINACSSQL